MNDRNSRIQNARQTLRIIEQGTYKIDKLQIDISRQIEQSVKETILYRTESFPNVEAEIAASNLQTVIRIKNCTAMQAGEELIKTGERTACLNFASAKNPGGGFLNGAQAQEESLTKASSLYPTLMKYFTEMYEYNRSRNTYLYSDHMIYSPGVVFFRNDEDELLASPYLMDILTSPAVNIGAMKQNKPEELPLAKGTMLRRIDRILSVFVSQKAKNLILGAFGCGVFQNNPEDVAQYFAGYLTGNGKYAKCFNKIIFAVFDRSKTQENIRAFEQTFKQFNNQKYQ
jgi:uncharacterized protein (TIGR02452 family)